MPGFYVSARIQTQILMHGKTSFWPENLFLNTEVPDRDETIS